MAAVYLELAVLVRALEGLTDAARLDTGPDRASLWAGLFDLPRHAARLDGRRSPRDRGVAAGELSALQCLTRPRIIVVGSVNLDLVARCERLPRPGETVTGATFDRFPGGKGANQAVACARLGADVTLVAAVGTDSFADEALAGLREAGVELDLQRVMRRPA